MATGSALEFQTLFGRVNELKDQNVKTGGLAYLEIDIRKLFYFMTKCEVTNCHYIIN